MCKVFGMPLSDPPVPVNQIFFSMLPPPPRSTLFPYTTLFRSQGHAVERALALERDAGTGERPDGRPRAAPGFARHEEDAGDRKSTRLNSSHQIISYAVFCLKKKRGKHRERGWPRQASLGIDR